MILGSIRVRKEHPLVRREGTAGAARVMLSYGVDVLHPERIYDVGWAYAYDIVPAGWLEGYWTSMFEGGKVHKVWGRRLTHAAVPEISAEDVRRVRETLALKRSRR